MKPVTAATLARLDAADLGSGASPSTDGGDDRSGRYWKVVDSTFATAIKIALITGRPLLLEGDSGCGKSSLARAVAATLGWTYYETVVTSQAAIEQLTGSVDHVQRLHAAELCATTRQEFDADPAGFLVPGVLWWAFAPDDAAVAGRVPEGSGRRTDPGVQPLAPNVTDPGAVVLIDEIDKADPDLPNNLLVPLGSHRLAIEARAEAVEATRPVLVCVTSNKERDMPPAFLRRCVTVSLTYRSPDDLVEIAIRHVAGARQLAATVKRLFLDGPPERKMSTAEFVDAVRAAVGLGLDAAGKDPVWAEVRAVLSASHERRRM